MCLRKNIINKIKTNLLNDSEISLIDRLLIDLGHFFYYLDIFNKTYFDDLFYFIYLEENYYTYIQIALEMKKHDAPRLCRMKSKMDNFIIEFIKTNPKYIKLRKYLV